MFGPTSSAQNTRLGFGNQKKKQRRNEQRNYPQQHQVRFHEVFQIYPSVFASLLDQPRRTCEANVLVFYSLHVESDGGDSCHHLPELELVQDRRLTGCVQTDLSILT